MLHNGKVNTYIVDTFTPCVAQLYTSDNWVRVKPYIYTNDTWTLCVAPGVNMEPFITSENEYFYASTDEQLYVRKL